MILEISMIAVDTLLWVGQRAWLALLPKLNTSKTQLSPIVMVGNVQSWPKQAGSQENFGVFVMFPRISRRKRSCRTF